MIYQIILLYLSRHVYILLKLYFIPIPQNNQKYIVFDFFLEKNIWFITYDSKKLLCHIYPILNIAHKFDLYTSSIINFWNKKNKNSSQHSRDIHNTNIMSLDEIYLIIYIIHAINFQVKFF